MLPSAYTWQLGTWNVYGDVSVLDFQRVTINERRRNVIEDPPEWNSIYPMGKGQSRTPFAFVQCPVNV